MRPTTADIHAQLIRLSCAGHLDALQDVLRSHPTTRGRSIHEALRHAFGGACTQGHLHVARYLHEIRPAVLDHADWTLVWVCENGHLPIAQWLLHVQPTLDVHAYDEWALREACDRNHLHVARWLVDVRLPSATPSPTCVAKRVAAFLNACNRIDDDNDGLLVAQWLWDQAWFGRHFVAALTVAEYAVYIDPLFDREDPGWQRLAAQVLATQPTWRDDERFRHR